MNTVMTLAMVFLSMMPMMVKKPVFCCEIVVLPEKECHNHSGEWGLSSLYQFTQQARLEYLCSQKHILLKSCNNPCQGVPDSSHRSIGFFFKTLTAVQPSGKVQLGFYFTIPIELVTLSEKSWHLKFTAHYLYLLVQTREFMPCGAHCRYVGGWV